MGTTLSIDDDVAAELRRLRRCRFGTRPVRPGKVRQLIRVPAEQVAIADIGALRSDGKSLMATCDELAGRGVGLSNQAVANRLARQADAEIPQ
jgi:hypothetical protein